MGYMRDVNGIRLDSIPVSSGGPPVVKMSRLPNYLDGAYGYNGAAFGWDNLWTDNGTQYAVWTDSNKHIIVGKRTLPDGAWSTFDLIGVAGNPLAIPASPEDFHLLPRISVDSSGYIHVTANFHTDVFRYVRSTNPNDITAWATNTANMPQDGTQNSYPTFVKCNDGTLLCFYRRGPSGNGDLWLNKLTTVATGVWTSVGKILDGITDTLSSYWNHISIERANSAHPGRIHMSWTWRNGAPYNYNVVYGYSDDNGTTWRQTNGTAYTLPLRASGGEVAVTTAQANTGLLNSCGMDVDLQGRPHIAMFYWDGSNNTQLHHIWRDTGGTWHNDTITKWTRQYDPLGTSFANGAVTSDIARPAVICPADGQTYILYRNQWEGKRGTVRAINCTPGRTDFPDFALMELDLHDWEPIYDCRALYERNELHMLAIPCKSAPPTVLTNNEYFDPTQWTTQLGIVVSYDLTRMLDIASGKVRLPRVKLLGSAAISPAPTAPTTTSAADVDLAVGTNVIVTPQETRNAILVGRMLARANVSVGSGTFTLHLHEHDDTANTDSTLTALPYGAGNVVQMTPWVPLIRLPGTSVDLGWLSTYGLVTGGATGRITMLRNELGAIVV